MANAVIESWCQSFDHEKQSYDSLAVFAEGRLREVLANEELEAEDWFDEFVDEELARWLGVRRDGRRVMPVEHDERGRVRRDDAAAALVGERVGPAPLPDERRLARAQQVAVGPPGFGRVRASRRAASAAYAATLGRVSPLYAGVRRHLAGSLQARRSAPPPPGPCGPHARAPRVAAAAVRRRRSPSASHAAIAAAVIFHTSSGFNRARGDYAERAYGTVVKCAARTCPQLR